MAEANVKKINKPVGAVVAEEQAKPKKKKKGKLKLILILVLFLIVAAFVVMVVMNLFGLRTMIVRGIVAMDPEYQSMFNEVEAKSLELEELATQLTQRQEELIELEGTLSSREEQVVAQEEALRQEQQAAREAEESPEVTEETLSQISKIYEDMDPTQAAQVLVALGDDQQVANILMTQTQARYWVR